jgi:hypothetical protein
VRCHNACVVMSSGSQVKFWWTLEEDGIFYVWTHRGDGRDRGRSDAGGGGGLGLNVKCHNAPVVTSSGNEVRSWGTLEEDAIF